MCSNSQNYCNDHGYTLRLSDTNVRTVSQPLQYIVPRLVLRRTASFRSNTADVPASSLQVKVDRGAADGDNTICKGKVSKLPSR